MTEKQNPNKLTGRGGPGRGQGRHPKAGKGNPTRLKWGHWLAPETIEKIKQLADETGLSQGEIVDQAIALLNLKDLKTDKKID